MILCNNSREVILFQCAHLILYSKYGPYDYSSYNGRLADAVRHPVAQKKHQMFGKRYLQDQTNTPNMSQSASNAGVVGPPPQQPEMAIKYEFEPYPMHHPLATNLDGAAGGMAIMNKHQAQQQSAADMKYYQVSAMTTSSLTLLHSHAVMKLILNRFN